MVNKIQKGDLYIFLFFFLNLSLISTSSALINLSYLAISILSIYYFKFKDLKKIEVILFLLLVVVIFLSTFKSSIPFDAKKNVVGWLKYFFLLIFLINLTFFLNKKNYSRVSNYILYIIYLLIIDIFLQRFFNFEIFGNEIIIGRLTGPYHKELIVGGIILIMGFVPLVYKIKKYLSKKKFIKSQLLLNLFFLSIFITGERMNTLLSLLAMVLFLFSLKKYKKFIFSFLVIYFLSVSTIALNYKYKDEKYFLKRYESFLFLLQTTEIYCGDVTKGAVQVESCEKYQHILEKEDLIVKKREKLTILDNAWAAHFLTAFEIWKDHKFIGAGNKAFRYLCHEYDNINSKRKDIRCSTHPHNFYFEIISEFGVIGLFLFLALILSIFFKTLKNLVIIYKDKSKDFVENYKFEYRLIIALLIIFIVLIWPIKSTGRLSSTIYGGLFWINIFFLCSLNYRIKKILNKISKF